MGIRVVTTENPRPRLGIGLLTVAMALLVLQALLLGGCGYHAVRPRGPLADANGVNVVLFANKSYRSGLEGTLARDLVDQLALRSGGKVLPAEEAQLELTGSILSYSALPVSYTRDDTIKEYRATISVQAILREQKSKKVVWKADLTEDQTFPVNENLALQHDSEEAAAAKACRMLSEDIWRKIGEAF